MAKPDKILAHELLGREVLNLQAGEVAGSVVDFGINRDGKVQLIGVLPAAWYSGGRGIAPSAITFLTGDRMCIANGEALQDFAPDGDNLISTDSGGQIYGKTVLLHDGEMLGELVDFRFNLGDGRISDLLVLDGEQRRTRVPIEKITTIGKDYIIIERAAASSEGEPTGEAAPFSSAAAAAPAPAAAEPEAQVAEEPAATLMPSPGGRSKGGRGRHKEFAAEPAPAPAAEPEPQLLPEDAGPAAEPPVEEAPAGPEAVADRESSAPLPVANLDAVFVVPAPADAPQPGLLGGFDAPAPAAVESEPPPPAETDADAFAARGLTISKFDQKKLDFLRGKAAHRDIKDPDGVILVAHGEALDQAALVRIVEGGVLGEVFIEMTLKK